VIPNRAIIEVYKINKYGEYKTMNTRQHDRHTYIEFNNISKFGIKVKITAYLEECF
jgi:hypothetical protein